jgi:electron transport complex protein RnfE
LKRKKLIVKDHTLTDGLFRQNIVLMSALVTAPVIAAATTLLKSAALCVGFSLVSFFTILVCRFIPHKIVYTLRIILYALTAAVIYMPVWLLLRFMFGIELVHSLGVYLPILVTNSLIMAKTEVRFYLRDFKTMNIEVFLFILGFDAVCLLMGGIREILAHGTLAGQPFSFPFVLPAAETTFGGFILLGLISAFCRAVYFQIKNRSSKKTMTELIKER